jgi:activator of HSP90 ATPase
MSKKVYDLMNPEDLSVIKSYLQVDDASEDFLHEDFTEESDIASEDEVEERDIDSETEQECEETDDKDSAEGTNYFLGKDKITLWSDNPPLREPHNIHIFLDLQEKRSQRKLLWIVGIIYLPTKS